MAELKIAMAVGTYCVAIAVALWMALYQFRNPPRPFARGPWLAIAAIFAALLAWRLLGGDQAMHQLMRSHYGILGGYRNRRVIQVVAIGIMFTIGGLAFAWVLPRLPRWTAPDLVAAGFASVLAAYGLVRGVSLHFVDKLIYASVGPLNVNRIFEPLVAIAIMAMAVPWVRAMVAAWASKKGGDERLSKTRSM